jgi:hypothetical protein
MIALCSLKSFKAQEVVEDKQILSLSIEGVYLRSGLYLLLSGNTMLKPNLDMRVSFGANLRMLHFGTFSPITALDFSYDFLKNKQHVFLGPSVRVQLTSIRLSNDNFLITTEGLAGYMFSVGKKFHLTQSAYFGYGNERSDFTNVSYGSYLIQLGIGYNFK